MFTYISVESVQHSCYGNYNKRLTVKWKSSENVAHDVPALILWRDQSFACASDSRRCWEIIGIKTSPVRRCQCLHVFMPLPTMHANTWKLSHIAMKGNEHLGRRKLKTRGFGMKTHPTNEREVAREIIMMTFQFAVGHWPEKRETEHKINSVYFLVISAPSVF